MAGITSLQPVVVASKALKAARFFPVPHKFTLGLQPIKPSEWLHVPTAAEMRRKRELLDGIDLGLGSEVLQGVSRLWTLQPHLGTAAIERVASLAARAPALEDRRHRCRAAPRP